MILSVCNALLYQVLCALCETGHGVAVLLQTGHGVAVLPQKVGKVCQFCYKLGKVWPDQKRGLFRKFNTTTQ